MKVDPKNPDIVYVANTSTYRSTDGGKTFTASRARPAATTTTRSGSTRSNPQIILLASDQGATITVNGGQTWSSWYNQPTAQFYHVVTDNRFPYWVYGGQQESGSAARRQPRRLRRDHASATGHPVGAEEYGYVAPDPLDPEHRLRRQAHALRCAHRPGPEHLARAPPDRQVSLSCGPSRCSFRRSIPHVLFYAGQRPVQDASTAAAAGTSISPDLTREHPEVPGIDRRLPRPRR